MIFYRTEKGKQQLKRKVSNLGVVVQRCKKKINIITSLLSVVSRQVKVVHCVGIQSPNRPMWLRAFSSKTQNWVMIRTKHKQNALRCTPSIPIALSFSTLFWEMPNAIFCNVVSLSTITLELLTRIAYYKITQTDKIISPIIIGPSEVCAASGATQVGHYLWKFSSSSSLFL